MQELYIVIIMSVSGTVRRYAKEGVRGLDQL